METFKPDFKKQTEEDRVISSIFGLNGREGFARNVKKTLKWSDKGGPRFGTFLFIKDIAGSVQLKSKEVAILKGEISKEIKKIEAQKKEEEAQKKENSIEKISKEARKDWKEELNRSGGVDPSEI